MIVVGALRCLYTFNEIDKHMMDLTTLYEYTECLLIAVCAV